MIIKKNNLRLDLNDRLEDFDEYIEDPCIVFKKHNVIDPSSYSKLVEAIYKLNDFDYT